MRFETKGNIKSKILHLIHRKYNFLIKWFWKIKLNTWMHYKLKRKFGIQL